MIGNGTQPLWLAARTVVWLSAGWLWQRIVNAKEGRLVDVNKKGCRLHLTVLVLFGT